mmetsp:Transcript_8319/g.23833  ORF Transcript_8319/g.23833 Transcript_8319/m.23833 type:complete len:217 (+) Transcript_8319:638-1288(+)
MNWPSVARSFFEEKYTMSRTRQSWDSSTMLESISQRVSQPRPTKTSFVAKGLSGVICTWSPLCMSKERSRLSSRNSVRYSGMSVSTQARMASRDSVKSFPRHPSRTLLSCQASVFSSRMIAAMMKPFSCRRSAMLEPPSTQAMPLRLLAVPLKTSMTASSTSWSVPSRALSTIMIAKTLRSSALRSMVTASSMPPAAPSRLSPEWRSAPPRMLSWL